VGWSIVLAEKAITSSPHCDAFFVADDVVDFTLAPYYAMKGYI